MAWSPAIKAEWDEHQSRFATQWLVSMMQLKKLWDVKTQDIAELREAIDKHSIDPNVAPIMLKDVHLIEAALATDGRVASLDSNARGHFGRLAARLNSVRHILWVDPASEDEHAVRWLEAGAPVQRFRWLINYKR
jgi:hypothetical protein